MSEATVRSMVVYCDESCHDFNARHPFMSIGSLWVSAGVKEDVSKQFRALCRSRGLAAEVKWRKVSAMRLEDYKTLAKFFFQREELRFRAIVVDQRKVKLEEYHGRDKELAFYKFYYEMLEKWLRPGLEYLILLDFKRNTGAERYTTLHTYLARYLRGKAWIRDLTVIRSEETPLAQLCDLLTGAVAAAHNGLEPGRPKKALADYIAKEAGFSSLRVSTARGVDKLNIFKIDLA